MNLLAEGGVENLNQLASEMRERRLFHPSSKSPTVQAALSVDQDDPSQFKIDFRYRATEASAPSVGMDCHPGDYSRENSKYLQWTYRNSMKRG